MSVKDEKGTKNDEEEYPVRDILDVCGGYGPWQRTICIITFLSNYPASCQNLGYAFFTMANDHWCKRGPVNQNMTVDQWKNNSIPKETRDGQEFYSQCEMYDPNGPEGSTVLCDAWEFDSNLFETTIVDKWNLVCSDEWLISVTQSIYMAGFFTAVLVCGQLGDRFGRRPVVIFCFVLLQLSSTVIIFANSYTFYVIMRFFVGLGAAGLYTSLFVIMMEVNEASKRTLLGLIFGGGFAVCALILTLLAYLIRHWVYLQLALTLPSFGLCIIWWLIPESPRWLITQRRREEAMKILQKAAEKNGKSTADIYVSTKAFSNYLDKIEMKPKDPKATLFDLLKTPNMRKKTLDIFYCWFVISFVYYGLSLNTGDLGGDPFVNFAISSAVEIPAMFIAYFVLKYLGRKRPLAAALCISGLSCVMTIPAKNTLWAKITLAMLGKLCIAASFAVIYIYSAEIYPTVVRSVGVGASSTCARVGSMIAPFVKDADKAWGSAVPLGIYGGLSIIGGFLVLLLPETQNTIIPDTLEQGEMFGKKVKKPKDKDVEQTNL